MAKKYCPMMNGDTDESIFCMEKDCAWWSHSYKMCTVIIEGYLAGWRQAREEARG